MEVLLPVLDRGKLPRMQDFLTRLTIDGDTFGDLAHDSKLLERPVTSCPGWSGADLTLHLGNVYAWVCACLGVTERPLWSKSSPRKGQDIADWFVEQHHEVCWRLGALRDDHKCWTLFPAQSGTQFWTRRQAHETAIHLVDLGGPSRASFDAAFADDGIDELLLGFTHLIHTVFESPSTLAVTTTDTLSSWTVHLGAAGIEARRGSVSPDCEVKGGARDVYLALWNRGAEGELTVEGDAAVWHLFRETVRI